VAGLENGGIFRNLGHGVGDIVRLSEEFRAPKLSLSLSMGHQRRGGMILERAIGLVQQLRQLADDHRDEIRAIQITGFDDANEKVVLDLIEDRMTFAQQVRPDVNRTIPYTVRRLAVRQAWENRREELAQMFQRRQ
jgi:hypothetical protein